MMDYEKAKEKLKSKLKKTRYDHTLRVVETALQINQDLGLKLDEDRVKTASLLHDCAKGNELEYFKAYKDKYNLSEDLMDSFFDLHTKLGAIVAKEEYGVDDEEVLKAIRNHTTGASHMSDLEKLVYLSDSCEPGRDYPAAKKAREMAKKDLNLAVYQVMNSNIIHLIESNAIIDTRTVDARNYLRGELNTR